MGSVFPTWLSRIMSQVGGRFKRPTAATQLPCNRMLWFCKEWVVHGSSIVFVNNHCKYVTPCFSGLCNPEKWNTQTHTHIIYNHIYIYIYIYIYMCVCVCVVVCDQTEIQCWDHSGYGLWTQPMGIVLSVGSASAGRRYDETPSLISWDHTRNDPRCSVHRQAIWRHMTAILSVIPLTVRTFFMLCELCSTGTARRNKCDWIF